MTVVILFAENDQASLLYRLVPEQMGYHVFCVIRSKETLGILPPARRSPTVLGVMLLGPADTLPARRYVRLLLFQSS